MKSVSKLFLILFSSLILLTGCSQNPNDIAKQVAKDYGENNPQIVSVNSTKTDNDNSSMYLIHLKGHFHKGNLIATDLTFSALGNKNYVWAIVGSNNQNQMIWQDIELPK